MRLRHLLLSCATLAVAAIATPVPAQADRDGASGKTRVVREGVVRQDQYRRGSRGNRSWRSERVARVGIGTRGYRSGWRQAGWRGDRNRSFRRAALYTAGIGLGTAAAYGWRSGSYYDSPDRSFRYYGRPYRTAYYDRPDYRTASYYGGWPFYRRASYGYGGPSYYSGGYGYGWPYYGSSGFVGASVGPVSVGFGSPGYYGYGPAYYDSGWSGSGYGYAAYNDYPGYSYYISGPNRVRNIPISSYDGPLDATRFFIRQRWHRQ